jgi:hypothetical protein
MIKEGEQSDRFLVELETKGCDRPKDFHCSNTFFSKPHDFISNRRMLHPYRVSPDVGKA